MPIQRISSIYCLATVLLFVLGSSAISQIKIHSHNDYLRPRPFYDALEAGAWSIEADVFVIDSRLCVAHTDKEINRKKTLDKLYLEPMLKYCLSLSGRLSQFPKPYMPIVMIDIKTNHIDALLLLTKKLERMRKKLRKNRISFMPLFVISGDRPDPASFSNYPSYIQFDARPYEMYDSISLSKIAFISDQYLKYSRWNGTGELPSSDSLIIANLVHEVHLLNKPVRLWNTPDTPAAWKALSETGIDIINTDQPKTCAYFFRSNISR